MAVTTDIEHFASLLRDCDRAVVFTGAGISTESGIPDFRGPGGLWTKMKPIQFEDFVRSDEVRQRSWQQWFEHGHGLLDARPNIGHQAVAALVDRGVVSAVITQNVDNLHQASGVPDQRVIELHGNATYTRCLNCGLERDLEAIPDLVEGLDSDDPAVRFVSIHALDQRPDLHRELPERVAATAR